MKIYKTIYLSIYGCEMWVLTDKLYNKIQVLEMKYLRRVTNVMIMDKIRIDDIREELKL